jgi:hypothetical protein
MVPAFTGPGGPTEEPGCSAELRWIDADVVECRRLPGASRRAGQSIRWARATMIPSGPRTYAMRQICSY